MIRGLVFLLCVVFGVVFALNNAESVTLRFVPTVLEIESRVFVVVFAAFVVGAVFWLGVGAWETGAASCWGCSCRCFLTLLWVFRCSGGCFFAAFVVADGVGGGA